MAERTIEALEQDLKAEHDLYLRALADFDNYRRRTDRDQVRIGKETLRNFLVGLLDVMDDYDRSLTFAGDAASPLIEGFRSVHQKLLDLLEKEGVRPFESIGSQFDPALHEVVATRPATKDEQGLVLEEARLGYRWGDDLLRPARVVVGV